MLDAGTTAHRRSTTSRTRRPGVLQKRLIEHVRTLYRRNDLAGPLPLGELQSLALPFESYKLAFTPGLVAEVYGGRVTDAMLEDEGRYVHSEGDANWWIPSGRIFYSPDPADTPPQELAYARQHFFLPHRYRDPFHTDAVSTESFVTYDAYDLLVQETRDALGNRVTVGERNVDPTQPLVRRAPRLSRPAAGAGHGPQPQPLGGGLRRPRHGGRHGGDGQAGGRPGRRRSADGSVPRRPDPGRDRPVPRQSQGADRRPRCSTTPPPASSTT